LSIFRGIVQSGARGRAGGPAEDIRTVQRRKGGLPAVSMADRRSPVQKLGVADLDRTRLEILGDLVIILRQVTEQIL
jgi:hypothetical protein